jgi:thiamine-monophosphate kinase
MVWAQKIPVVDVPRELRSASLDPLKLALHGGEDYELLFTVPRKLVSRLPHKAGVSISIIGEMSREKEIVLVDAKSRRAPLKPMGWDPFRRRG